MPGKPLGPYVDPGTGGTITGMIAAADKSLSLADDYTKIVAGHGPLGNKADLMKSRDMLTTSRDRVEKLTSTGKSALEAVAEAGRRSRLRLGPRHHQLRAVGKACASSPGGQEQRNFGPIGRPWLYNPRMASLRHGFEEPGDIRLVVDTIPT